MSKVMVVDDDKDTVRLLKFLLEKAQLEVIETFNGLEAYTHLTAGAADRVIPDAIILDILMPEMDGYTLHSRLREIDGLRNIPIVILTAKSRMKDLFALSSNVFAIVEKPFEPDNFLKIVKGAIGGEQKRLYWKAGLF